MTGVRDDGGCDDYDDSSLEFLYSRTLDKSAILFALFEYLSEVFFLSFCYLRVRLLESKENLGVFSRRLIN